MTTRLARPRNWRCERPALHSRRSERSAWVCLRILEDFGVRPQMVGGHSFGELTALCAAGSIDDHSFAHLAERRGEVMATCARGGGAGAMLAVFAPLEPVARLLADHELDVVIANKNAPRQCVLSGPAKSIERARQLLTECGLTTHAVPVSAAFHSRAVATAEASFRETLSAVPFAPAVIPVFSNTTAAALSRRRRHRSRIAGRPARPAGRVCRPGRGNVSHGGPLVPRSRPRCPAHESRSGDPRGTRTSRHRRRRHARSEWQRVRSRLLRSQPWPRLGMLSILPAGTKGVVNWALRKIKRASVSRFAVPTRNRLSPLEASRLEMNHQPAPRSHPRNRLRRSPRPRRECQTAARTEGGRFRMNNRPFLPRSIGL